MDDNDISYTEILTAIRRALVRGNSTGDVLAAAQEITADYAGYADPALIAREDLRA